MSISQSEADKIQKYTLLQKIGQKTKPQVTERFLYDRLLTRFTIL